MPSWLRNTLMALLVTGLTWSAAVAYWRAAPVLPSAPTVAAVLLGAPLLLLGGLWLARRMLAPASPGASHASAAAPAPSAAPSAAPAAAPSLAIVAASLRMPHGASPAELLAAVEGGKARAALDPELVGDDGYPVMSARADAADDADGRERIAAWIARHGANLGELTDEQLRALLLGCEVASELGAAAVDACIVDDAEEPQLQLALLLPPEWNPELRRAAASLLRQAVLDAGWPDARVAALPAASIADVLPGGVHHAPLTMLLACASHVGESTVNQWSADLTLFSAAHQQGSIPGEGAAALLLSAAPELTLPRMSGAAALRDTPADGARRLDPALLETLATRALPAALVAPAQLAGVVADTGHRTAQVMELMALARAAAPQLDPADTLLAIGGASGCCGAPGQVAALAVAAERATALEAPVLCVTNEDPLRRSVLVIAPPAWAAGTTQGVVSS